MRRMLSMFLLLILTVSIEGCAAKEPYRIGFIGNVTGINSSTAIAGRNAVSLAVEEANKTGGINGRQVVLVVKDDQESPEAAAAVDKEFIQEGIPIVIGHYMSSVGEACLEAIKGQNILFLSPTMSATEFSGIDDELLRVILTNAMQGTTLGEYAGSHDKVRNTFIAMSESNQAFTMGVAKGYEKSFVAYGGKIAGIAEVTSRDLEGMQAIVEEAIEAQADAMLLVLNPNDLAMFAQLMRKGGLNVPIYSASWGMAADVIFRGGDAVEGTVFPAMYDSQSQNPEYLAFKENYESLYNVPVDYAAVYSYEAAKIALDALAHTEKPTGENLKQTILKTKVYQGLQSELVFQETGDVTRPFYLTQVKNGAFVTIERTD